MIHQSADGACPLLVCQVRDALLARQFEVDEENSGLTMAPVTLIEVSCDV